MDGYKQDFNCDIFTPEEISKIMQKFLSNKGSLLEPACGTGNLLKNLDLSQYDMVDIYDIKEEYLNKCPDDKNIRKFCNDFLNSENNLKYDNIITNPPYIRFQNLPEDYRKQLKLKWDILSRGNIDIYYAFIIKCLEVLSENGVLIVVCPNSYLYNKSAEKLREFLIKNKYIKEIIDFKHEKIFKNISTYCCISVFTKIEKNCLIYNSKNIEYKNISENNIFSNITTPGFTIGEICEVKNGVATLSDKVFVHKEQLYKEECWKKILCGNKEKFIIFPYDSKGKILPEKEFKSKNPKTFCFLEENKEILNKRDKGNKVYEKWYSFGRTQSLVINKDVKEMIYIPVLNDPNNFKIIKHSACLFKNCLSVCIKDNYKDKYSCDNIISIIKERLGFLTENCPKRSSGWLGVSSSVLKSIPLVSEKI